MYFTRRLMVGYCRKEEEEEEELQEESFLFFPDRCVHQKKKVVVRV